MFSRRERLSRAQFPTVLKAGRRFSSPNLSISVSDAVKGYAVVIPKKIARLSVTRHRVKRRILAALRSLSLPQSLIVFPKASASSVSYENIRSEIQQLLSKNKH